MRYVRYGKAGQEQAGLLDSQGKLRSLAPLVSDWRVEHLSDAWRAALKAIDIEKLPVVEGAQRLATPISGIGQVIGIGLNYRDHAAEAGMDLPSHPQAFQKSIASLSGPQDEILSAENAASLDWEVELACIIRKRARRVTAAEAADHIGGYLLAMDVSERDWQINFGGFANKGKSYDSFTPLGPWLASPDEIADPQNLNIWLSVNGEKQQNASTKEMVFSVAEIVSHLSQFQTLLPGDVILTGTPAGVGYGKKPRLFLKPGDTVTCGAEGLGEQAHAVTREG